jgi:hypothetical protein
MPQQQTISDEVFAPDPRQTITVDDADISSIKQPSNNISNNNNNLLGLTTTLKGGMQACLNKLILKQTMSEPKNKR